ncbi:MAG: hypothetical protein ACREJW_05345, partial [Candidatus Methylomirabilales bacterium]
MRAPLTVDEFLARFPEVPRDLRDEPILAEYVNAFDPLLRIVQPLCFLRARAGDLGREPAGGKGRHGQ